MAQLVGAVAYYFIKNCKEVPPSLHSLLKNQVCSKVIAMLKAYDRRNYLKKNETVGSCSTL